MHGTAACFYSKHFNPWTFTDGTGLYTILYKTNIVRTCPYIHPGIKYTRTQIYEYTYIYIYDYIHISLCRKFNNTHQTYTHFMHIIHSIHQTVWWVFDIYPTSQVRRRGPVPRDMAKSKNHTGHNQIYKFLGSGARNWWLVMVIWCLGTRLDAGGDKDPTVAAWACWCETSWLSPGWANHRAAGDTTSAPGDQLLVKVLTQLSLRVGERMVDQPLSMVNSSDNSWSTRI